MVSLRKIMRWKTILLTGLIFLFAAGARGEGKKKYEVSKMPKALYLTEPGAKDATLEFSVSACPEFKPKSDSAYGYLEVLTAGERRSGSQAMRCAVEFVRKTLVGFGYETSVISYRFPYYHVTSDLYMIKPDGSSQASPAFPLMYAPDTPGEIKAKVVNPMKVGKGDLVYVKGNAFGGRSLALRAEDWKKQGAVGLVLDPREFPFNMGGLPFPRSIHSTSWHYGPLPGIIVQDAPALVGKEVEFKSNCKIYAGTGYDVIAQTPGEFESYILIGGHLDSWFKGALDDGSGAAVMMRIAELMKNEKPGKVGLIFAAFDGEELGLIGSQYFWQKFGAGRIKAMLNLDMASVKNNFFHKDPAEAKVMPKLIETSPELRQAARESYSSLSATKLYTGMDWWRKLYGELPTDMEWFYVSGVPGVFIYTPDKYYHTPKDDMTWQDADDLEAVSRTSVEMVKKLQGMELERPKDALRMELTLVRQEDGGVALDVDLSKAGKDHLTGKVLVYCYYEHGFEKKVELKRNEGGSYSGSFSPFYRGEYQFLAIGKVGKEERKLIRSLKIEDPMAEEKAEGGKGQ